MARREALRAFQSRLAGRLQDARTSGAAASWLAVLAADRNFLFPLNHAGEIFTWTMIQPVPHAKSWFLGVANLRGSVSGVVDLGAFVTHAPAVPRTEVAQTQCRLVGFSDLLNVNCTVLIDRLAGLKSVGSFVSSVPAGEGSPDYFGHIYSDAQGAVWQEINLQALSVSPSFLNISA